MKIFLITFQKYNKTNILTNRTTFIRYKLIHFFKKGAKSQKI